MRIVYCLNSIQTKGGIENVVRIKANALSDRGYEVFIALADYNPKESVDVTKNIRIIDLGIRYYKDDWKSKYHLLKGIIFKRREHKKRLTRVLKKIQPDIVISVGQSEKYFLPEIKGKWKTIREFHYEKLYRLRNSYSWLSKVIARLINIYDYEYKIKQYDSIVVLTNEDKINNWKNKKAIVIPNPVNISINGNAKLQEKKIISVGRLVNQKNFFSLIRAFRLVVSKHPDWELDIYGEGILKEQLNEEIRINKLEDNVFLLGYHSNIKERMLDYSLFVLSSKFEGMPNVILEAMSCGLPIISYDCPCGPRDLICNNETGFLIPLNDEEMLANKICDLIENVDKRKSMGKNAREQIEQFSLENIVDEWVFLFNSLI